MTNEAVIIELAGQPKGVPIRGAVRSADAFEKGTIMYWADGRILSGSNTIDEPFAGFAATEKVAAEGGISLGVNTKGIFDLKACAIIGAEGAISVGNLVVISGANLIKAAPGLSGSDLSKVVGKALEDIAAGATGAVAVGIY